VTATGLPHRTSTDRLLRVRECAECGGRICKSNQSGRCRNCFIHWFWMKWMSHEERQAAVVVGHERRGPEGRAAAVAAAHAGQTPEGRRAQAKRVNEWRASHGLLRKPGDCVHCRTPATNGIFCDAHAQKNKDYRRMRRASWAAAGLCRDCGRERAAGVTYCERHLSKKREASRRRRAEGRGRKS
jgi:hypothetical protein